MKVKHNVTENETKGMTREFDKRDNQWMDEKILNVTS